MSAVKMTIYRSSQSIPEHLVKRVRNVAQLFSFPTKTGASEKGKLLWLIKLRWVAITLFFVLCGPALISGNLNRGTIPVYMGILGILILFNLLSQLVIAGSKQPIGPLIVCFQLSFDLIALSGLLAVSGGVANPFVILFLLNASLGGILIPGRLSWPFLLLTHTLLGALQFQVVLANHGAIDTSLMTGFLAFHIMILGFWLVMRSLGSYLEKQSELQNQSQIAIEKQDRLRSIGALAAGFSHEFASPLNVAKIRLERIARQWGTSEDISEARNAILACENVIHQMNSSQMDSRDLQFKTVLLNELLKDVIESWQEDKATSRITLIMPDNIECSLPPLNFSQVVINLLDNALEAKPQGLIRVTLSKSEHEIHLSFQDEGPGFLENILRQRGEPFITTKKNGTGLGLYVSELFALSLSGRLEIENKSSGGAVVSLSWPQKAVKE